MADIDFSKLKVADLKRELKLRGLVTTGNKNELQERLQTALLEGDIALDDTAISEDLLDDDVLTDEEKTLDLVKDEDGLSPPSSIIEKISVESVTHGKKVVLKRNISHNIIIPSEKSSAPTEDEQSSSEDPPNKVAKINSTIDTDVTVPSAGDSKKVVKLSEISIKDRLEMRAKKFGVSAPNDLVKQSRAERFGQTKSVGTLNSNGSVPQTSIDILKKRAERFGVSVSSRMTEIERQEKLLKRQERFGDASVKTASNPKTASSGNSNYAERAKQRLERFKTAVK